MTYVPVWPWIALFCLGAYHGVNPGMGWLFAVAQGMQKQSGSAVWLALLPIATGHALAIGLIVAAAALLGTFVPLHYVRIFVACVLFGFALYLLWRKGHPKWGGMQVGFRDLTIWSFLMASAHGAGFMLLPVLLALPAGGAHHHMPTDGPSSYPLQTAVLAISVHTLGYLLATGALAFVTYKWVGLSLLRRAWVNLDLLWAAALLVAGVTAVVW